MDGNMINDLNQPHRKKAKRLILAAVILLILAGLAVLCAHKMYGMKMKRAIKSDYQAVFLTNGQVYFGKMEFKHGWVVLKDIYYLQLAQELQPASSNGSDTSATPETQQNQQQKIQLVKLGAELHGPQDEMYVARDKVMFWENMKDDSKVLQSIRQFQGQ